MAGQATVTIRDRQWDVSLAITPYELMRGLGNIPQIPPQTGMLFDLGTTRIIQVTTVPMLFSLDIAFLSETLVVTEVYRNIEPGYLVTSTLPASYFLEVNAGELGDTDAGDRATVEVVVPAQAAAPDWVTALFGFMGLMVVGVLTVSLVRELVKGLLEEPEKPPLLAQTEAGFKPGEIVKYKGEKENLASEILKGLSSWEAWQKRELSRLPHAELIGQYATPTESGKQLIACATDHKTYYDAILWLEGNKFVLRRLVEAGKGLKRWNAGFDFVDEKEISKDEVLKRIKTMEITATRELLLKAGLLETEASIIPIKKHPRREGELEFLADSPEFLAYTIDDIGYRERIDTAFQQAISRVKRSRPWP